MNEHDHLTPEALVDAAEGGGVDQAFRRHLEGCQRCAAELGEIRDTLALLKSGEEDLPEPDSAYWEEFDARFRRRLATDAPAGVGWRNTRWLAAAAVLLAMLAAWHLRRTDRPPVSAPSRADRFLPPPEDDPEFQLLLGVAAAVADGDESDLDSFEAFGMEAAGVPFFALSDDEALALREALERDLEGERNGAS